MIKEDLASFEENIAEILYNVLISVPKAEDFAVMYYRMELKKQKATEADLQKFSKLYGKIFTRKMSKKVENSSRPLTKTQRDKLVKSSLSEAWKLYIGEGDG